MNVHDTLQDFLGYLGVEKKYSLHTLISYENDISQFISFTKMTYDIDAVSSLRHTHIRTWIVHLISEGISSISVNRKISVLRSWHKWMLKRKIISSNPMLKILGPKKPKRLPISIAGSHLKHIIEAPLILEGEDPFMKIRDNFIIELLYSTGIRRAELVSLTLGDIDVSRRDLKVLGKGNKVRIIPITDALIVSFGGYLKVRDNLPMIVDSGHLFLTEKGRKIYPRLVHSIVHNQLSHVTTLSKKSPHVLRHSFATHMLDEGADLNAIKEILGHSSLAATQIYTHNSISKLKETYAKSHPRSRE